MRMIRIGVVQVGHECMYILILEQQIFVFSYLRTAKPNTGSHCIRSRVPLCCEGSGGDAGKLSFRSYGGECGIGGVMWNHIVGWNGIGSLYLMFFY